MVDAGGSAASAPRARSRMTPAATRAWRALAQTTTLLGAELERQAQRDAGLPHAYYALLVQLYEADDRRLRMGELAERAGVSRSRLTHAVASMERSGWVTRSRADGDGRGQQVAMTDAGVELVRRFSAQQLARVRVPTLAGLDDAQLGRLAELLETVVGTLAERAASPGSRS